MAGRIYGSKIAIKSKGRKLKNYYNFIDQKRNWSTQLAVILNIKLTFSNIVLGLIKYINGTLSVIKLPYGLLVGSFIKSTLIPVNLYKINVLGFRVFLYLLSKNLIFFDLSRYNENAKYIRSNGTFSQILNINKDLNLISILLPSGKKKYVDSNYLCTLGRNNSIYSKLLVTGKAGISRKRGIHPKVRGVAMNPVDHPHGGRTKTNKPEVSPWGWVTKHSH